MHNNYRYHHAALRQDGTLHSVGVSRRNIRCKEGESIVELESIESPQDLAHMPDYRYDAATKTALIVSE
jgi:hypothetical protein